MIPSSRCFVGREGRLWAENRSSPLVSFRPELEPSSSISSSRSQPAAVSAACFHRISWRIKNRSEPVKPDEFDGCGPAKMHSFGRFGTGSIQLNKTLLLSAFVISSISSSAFSAELTVSQRVVAQEMNETVLSKGVAQRIVELCADFTVDDQKLSAKRDVVMGIAKTMFASGDTFMEAAGINEKAKMGEDLRRFFLDRGVAWDSPSKKYCELADALKTAQSPVAHYLLKR